YRHWTFHRLVGAYRKAHRTHLGMRELAAEMAAMGLDPTLWGRELLLRWHMARGWTDDELWPYFLEHSVTLEEALSMRPGAKPEFFERDARKNALAVLGMMPSPPSRFHPVLWDLAFGSAQVDREFAQRAAMKIPGARENIVAGLASGKQEVREIAANWLAA